MLCAGVSCATSDSVKRRSPEDASPQGINSISSAAGKPTTRRYSTGRQAVSTVRSQLILAFLSGRNTNVGERRTNMRRKPSKPHRQVIFRRYRTLADGTVLDARDYGFKAWPMHLK